MKPYLLLPIIFFVFLGVQPATAQTSVDPHSCTWCHGLHNGGTGTLPLTGFSLDQDLCLTCHDTVGNPSYPTAPLGMKSHTGPKHTLAGDSTTCWDCHDHFGESAWPNNSDPAFTNRNDFLIARFRPVDPLLGNTRPSRYPLSLPQDLTTVFTPRTDLPGAFTYSNGDGSGLCEACHESTLFNRASGGNTHEVGNDCTQCHQHTAADGFAPSGCTGCHSQVQDNLVGNPKRAIMPEFDATSHHINWKAAGYASASDIPKEDCQVCHNPDSAFHKDEIVDLNDVDTGAKGVYNASVASELATFCIKCHDGDGAQAEPVPMQPFSDGMTPPTIDGNTWLTQTKHGANFTTSTVPACLGCHTSGHGKDKDALFVVCETCHGLGGTPIAAVRVESHFTPTDSPVHPSDIPCEDCHTPHTNLKNKFYTDGSVNSHPHYNQAGGIQAGSFGADGYNIMLYGRQDDGDTASTRLPNPMRIIAVGGGPCTLGNTQVQIYLPAYEPDGDGLVFTPMVGDRVKVFNSNDPNFNGIFRILETNLSGWTTTEANGGPRGWICYDNPTPATHSGFGWVSGFGWGQRPIVGNAQWSGGAATLYFSGPTSLRFGLHSIKVNDTINVMGVSPTGYNGQFVVTAVTDSSVSYVVGDPGAYISGGLVEYVGSVKGITNIVTNGTAPAPPPTPLPDLTISNAVWAAAGKGKPDRVTITVSSASHNYVVNDAITVSGVNPSGYNGTYVVYAVAGTDITYTHGPTNPGAYISGGTVPDNNPVSYPAPPAGPHTITVTLNLGSNSPDILDMTPGTAGLKDGDIVRIYGVNYTPYWPAMDKYGFNERWQIAENGINTSTNPATITLRCPPKTRTALGLPKCNIWEFWNGYISGGVLQSTSTLRDTVFDSRGSDLDAASFSTYLNHDEHSFATQDIPVESQDGYMYGPCELCHTSADISKHRTTEYGTTHNNGRTCTTQCHFHIMGFDKANAVCDRQPCWTP